MILLPLLVLAGFVAIARKAIGDWLAAFACGAVAWGCTVVFVCEALSPFRALTFAGLSIVWALLGIAAMLVFHALPASPTPIRFSFRLPDGSAGRFCLAFLALALTLTAVAAFLGEPSRWDMLTYHMPRVAHWAQNQSVLFYPTHIERQIWAPPAAGYIMLQFFVLSGGSDAVAAFLPWGTYAGCIALSALIARELGADKRGQLLAMLVTATTPGAIAQASGGQVDIIAALWISVLAWLGVRIIYSDRIRWPLVVLAGAALGLGLLTKGTVYIFVFPFLLWFFVALLRRNPRMVVPIAMVVLGLALAMAAPQFSRNAAVFRRGIRGPSGDQTMTTRRTPGAVASNILRNTALHFGTRIPAVDSGVYRAIAGIHAAAGVPLNDTATTWNYGHFIPVRHSFSDERGGSPLHLLLIAAATMGLMILARRRGDWRPALFALVTVASYLMFCLMIKFQPWHARMHLPVLMLAAAPVGMWLGFLRPRMIRTIAVVLGIAALPVILLHPDRSLAFVRQIYFVPRSHRYFMQAPELRESYVGAARYLRQTGCGKIGVWIGGDDVEYPLWALLRSDGGTMPEIRHVQILNVSVRSPLEHDPFVSCAIIHIDNIGWPRVFRVPSGFSPGWKNRNITILARHHGI